MNQIKEAPMDYYQQEDLENIVFSYQKRFYEVKGSTFFITGATGLIGSQIIKTLLCCNRLLGTQYKIIGFARNIKKAETMFGPLLEKDGFSISIGDLTEPINIEGNIDYIIHTASITASKVMISMPVDVIRTSILGTDHILTLAKNKNCKSVVFLSSMEAYGRPVNPYVTEPDLGYIDLNNPRNCYPESKRMCECLCKAYSVQYGVNVKSVRLAQTFGPGILPSDNRVFVQFAKSVIYKKDIVLHTEGKSEGNYCYLRDAIKAIFTILFSGKPGETYNVSNEKNHMSISEMAHLVAEEVAEGNIKVVYDIPADIAALGFAPDTKLKLNTKKVRSLGWEPEILLTDMYIRMIESIKANSIF